MLTFWIIAGVMLLVAVALVLVPILRPRRDPGISHYDASVATHRQRLENLQEQHAEGALDSADFEQAREELQAALIAEIQDPESPDPAPSGTPHRGSKAAAVAVLIALPALSLGLYAWLGNYQGMKIIEDPQAMQTLMEQHPPSRETVAHMVTNLKLRLRRTPDDIKSWELLARAQLSLNRFADAAATLDHVIRAYGETADRLTDYAEAASMANRMRFTGEARSRLERALALSPKHPKALMLGALAALHAGRKNEALAHWRTLLSMQAPGSEQADFIGKLISRTEKGESLAPALPAARPGPPATAQSAPAATAATTAARINVDLSLAPTLREKITGQERVFVFARAVGGPPMPVAVKILKAGDLPASLVLDDSSSMPSGRPLSSVEQVQVAARISFSGSASPSSGDLEGTSEPLRTQDNPALKLVIDSVRP